MTLQEIIDKYPDDEFLTADGFDKAVIGVTVQVGKPKRLIYSENLCINILVREHGMTFEEAIEHFYHNVKDGDVGPQTPVFK